MPTRAEQRRTLWTLVIAAVLGAGLLIYVATRPAPMSDDSAAPDVAITPPSAASSVRAPEALPAPVAVPDGRPAVALGPQPAPGDLAAAAGNNPAPAVSRSARRGAAPVPGNGSKPENHEPEKATPVAAAAEPRPAAIPAPSAPAGSSVAASRGTVAFDERALGTAGPIALAPGAHIVTLDAPGVKVTLRLIVAAEGGQPLRFNLAAKPWADVTINGVDIGQTPVTGRTLARRAVHRIQVRAGGAEPVELTLSLD